MSEIIQIVASSYTIILLNRTETDHQQHFPSKILFIISRSIRKRNRYYEYNDSLRFPQQYQTSPAPTATSIELNLNKYQISPFKKKTRFNFQSWLKKKKYKFTLAILSIFNNLWTRLSFEALHNRVIDSTITTYHHLSRLVPSRTSGRRSREAVVTAIHASIVCSAFLHIYIYIYGVCLSRLSISPLRVNYEITRVLVLNK